MSLIKRIFSKKAKWKTMYNKDLAMYIALDENLKISYMGTKEQCDFFIKNMIEEEEGLANDN